MNPVNIATNLRANKTRSASGAELAGWRSFLLAMLVLFAAFGLAMYSGAAAQSGAQWTAVTAAIVALGLAGWVAFRIVPVLARRTPLRWLAYQINYRVTRTGIVYLGAILVVAAAALNTGNNLLFLILGCMLAGIAISGILSRMTLTGIEVDLDLPDHVFAAKPSPAIIELRNLKHTLPSFALRVAGQGDGSERALLDSPVYFPYVPRKQSVRSRVELLFPKRGRYRQDALAIRSSFPFGFLEKMRKLPARAVVTVYPAIEPTETFYEILPLLSGELESYQRGRGHDLYAIREFVATDSARFVDWKASAKSGSLKVREFAREDERRVLLALDPFLSSGADSTAAALSGEQFERAVSFCACLAWHFYEIDAVIGLRMPGSDVGLGAASDNVFDILSQLAVVQSQTGESGRGFLNELTNETNVFKIVLTSRPRGTIPTTLWSSAYVVFFDSL